jgi:H+/Cl- antiporter ClcA
MTLLTQSLISLRSLARWLLLAGIIGALAGTASALFLALLDLATNIRLENAWLLFLLPLAGLAIGYVYHTIGAAAARGSHLVIEALHLNAARIPLRMTPLVLAGTVLTHLFGGSAGREGTAVQMGASLADVLRRLLNISGEDRRLMIMAGISGGFASVFGTPVAGLVFALEVGGGRVRYDGLLPALVAALVGDGVARLWGATHTHYPLMTTATLDAALMLKVVIASVGFGCASLLFIELTRRVKQQAARIPYPPLRPFVGGIVVITLTLLVGTQDYLGLGIPLIRQSVEGADVATLAFFLKIIFTAVTLGTGFVGGEVTPLFVIGATLGATLGGVLGVDPAWLAMVGFVAVFAGASNTPLACALMGIELFGGGAALYLVVGCMVAYLASGERSIYPSYS